MAAVLIDIFSLLTAAAGWYYIFYSRAAQKLESVETHQLNRRRVRLRRIGGGFMMLLGVLFFAGFQNLRPIPYIAVWVGVLLSLCAIVVLALIDVRLTWKLQKSRRRPPL
jgi:drug/metabolite transporter (DMT)-like permease